MHDLEPNASLFATRKACEPVHLQLNEKTWAVQVINNLGRPLQRRARPSHPLQLGRHKVVTSAILT